ncbi:SixA phosphatase family protein [Aquimarina hainanensis]|uniref:SixA phosphatase family protein n=1 Tax=Aquimarina hainanensis TaxID=1578017 RepID=A0ABW5NC19_9FLAO
MKTLYLIRHAKSSWEFDLEDHKRPLNSRGLKDAKRIGEKLETTVKMVDRVLCSTATRAKQTAEIITPYLKIKDEQVHFVPELYDFNGAQVMKVIKECDNEVTSLIIFGHNHALTSLVNLLGSQMIDNLPTAGVVGIEFDVDQWGKIDVGNILLSVFPKHLR